MPVSFDLRMPDTATANSPLALCDRLLRLAQDAGQAGFPVAAEHLLYLADTLFEPPAPHVAARSKSSNGRHADR